MVEIAKPDAHRRTYSHLELENGLKAVVASDAACDKAGAAACVNVGMCHERKDLPGLAHFLEHMLFTGSKKYPKEGEYHEFIQQNGGMANAYTTCYFTNYMLSVKPDMLIEAVDRFSRFFTEPTLTRDCTEREINAVDSEFQAGHTQPWWRMVGILDMSANPEHPFHVACGNNKVLMDEPKARGIDLYDEMKNLYDSCYSANGMTICIIGKEPIAELEALVREKFGAVVNKGVKMPIGKDHSDKPPFLPADWHRLLLQTPVKDVKEFTLSWVIPYQAPAWRSKPSFYIMHLLGHEGKGSAIAALKNLGLISACMTFDGAWLQGAFSFMNLNIDLTEKGLTNLKEIGTYYFTYLGMLKKVGVEKWIWDEISNLQKTQFKMGEDMQPFDLSAKIAMSLQKHPPSEVLAGEALLYDYDPEAINEILNMLTLDTVRVQHQHKSLADRCTDKDKSYDSPMKFEDIPADWLDAWGAALNASDPVAAAAKLDMSLPKPNPFIPEDLSLRDLPAEPPQLPKRVVAEALPIACVLHRQDDVFRQPKARVTFHIRSPFIVQDVQSFVKTELWCQALIEDLNEYSYDATLAGLGYDVGLGAGAMSLTISGFNDKLGVLLSTVTARMREMMSVPETIFSIVADSFGDDLRNQAYRSQPYIQALMRWGELSARGTDFPVLEKLKAFEALKREDLDGIPALIFDKCHVECVGLGNLTGEDACRLADLMAKGLKLSAGLETLPDRREATLHPGATVWNIDSTDPDDANHCVIGYLQTPVSDEAKVCMNLVTTILGPKFFEKLRTQQQLGYIVNLGATPSMNFMTLRALIQSEYSPDYVRGKIVQFLDEHIKFLLEELAEEEFKICCAGLLSELQTKAKNLGEEWGTYARHFQDRTYDFGAKKRMIGILEAPLTKSAFCDWVRSNVAPAARLFVQVKKVMDKPDKELPEGASIPEDPPDIRKWNGREDVIAEFERTCPAWISWKGSSPVAWKSAL